MDATIIPAHLEGSVRAPASKSIAQRLLILAALADAPTFIAIEGESADIAATVRCLAALGARIVLAERREGDGASSPAERGLLVEPLPRDPSGRPVTLSPVTLDCGESGATLRFLLPVVGALGAEATFTGDGRLPRRPLSPLDRELASHGMRLSRDGGDELPLTVFGALEGGRFELPGDVSSQFVSGLLLAAPLLDDDVEVRVLDPFESRPYVGLTCSALASFGVYAESARPDAPGGDEGPLEGPRAAPATSYRVFGGASLRSPGAVSVEGDWSQAAFWLAADALGASVTVRGLDLRSAQGDRAVLAALALLGVRVVRETGACRAFAERPRAASFDVADTPDLVPPLAAVCAVADGVSRIRGAGRLRLKESDRLESIRRALEAFGARAAVEGDDLVIEGVPELHGCAIDAAGDHRIAMMAAVCALRAHGSVIIEGADCVEKSYPTFFEDYRALGGTVREN